MFIERDGKQIELTDAEVEQTYKQHLYDMAKNDVEAYLNKYDLTIEDNEKMEELVKVFMSQYENFNVENQFDIDSFFEEALENHDYSLKRVSEDIEDNVVFDKALDEIFDNLKDYKVYGRQISVLTNPYFKEPYFDTNIALGGDGYIHYHKAGSSAIQADKEQLDWLIRTIYQTTPKQFVKDYEVRDPHDYHVDFNYQVLSQDGGTVLAESPSMKQAFSDAVKLTVSRMENALNHYAFWGDYENFLDFESKALPYVFEEKTGDRAYISHVFENLYNRGYYTLGEETSAALEKLAEQIKQVDEKIEIAKAEKDMNQAIDSIEQRQSEKTIEIKPGIERD